MVPIVYPKKTHPIMDMLSNLSIRRMAGVSDSNTFLLAYTMASDNGAVGFNEIDFICKHYGIDTIAPLAVRHRYATRFRNIPDVHQEKIMIFLDHIGHDIKTDQNSYVSPPALQILRIIPKLLEEIKKVSLLQIY